MSDLITTENLVAIAAERERQREIWGDRHDDANGDDHLVEQIEGRVEHLLAFTRAQRGDLDPRHVAIEIGALALAWLDRDMRQALETVVLP